MVETIDVTASNGEAPVDSRLSTRELPAFVSLTAAELTLFPSPGTQRALKAETGKDYMILVGPDADSADRTQTQIWTKLRKQFPGLRWSECEEVELQIADAEPGAVVNPPLLPVSSVLSPASVDSGG